MLSKRENFTALFILIPAALMILTDLFDGYIARKTQTVTNTGKILDAVVDKVIIDICAFILVMRGEIPFPLFFILLIRDISIGIAASKLLSGGLESFKTNILGRLTPLAWAFGMSLVVVNLRYFAMFVLVLGDILAVVSGVIYITNIVKLRSERGKK